MRTLSGNELPYGDHPLIVGIAAAVPHMAEAGVFAGLVLSIEAYRDTGVPCIVHLYGRYLPGFGRTDAHLDLDALMDRLAAEDLSPEIWPAATRYEESNPAIAGTDLLLAWEDDPRDGVPTMHVMTTLYEATQG